MWEYSDSQFETFLLLYLLANNKHIPAEELNQTLLECVTVCLTDSRMHQRQGRSTSENITSLFWRSSAANFSC